MEKRRRRLANVQQQQQGPEKRESLENSYGRALAAIERRCLNERLLISDEERCLRVELWALFKTISRVDVARGDETLGDSFLD